MAWEKQIDPCGCFTGTSLIPYLSLNFFPHPGKVCCSLVSWTPLTYFPFFMFYTLEILPFTQKEYGHVQDTSWYFNIMNKDQISWLSISSTNYHLFLLETFKILSTGTFAFHFILFILKFFIQFILIIFFLSNHFLRTHSLPYSI